MCNKEIDKENTTSEHILLNSIGGRLKSTKLICKSCNSKFGNTIDSQLSEQLNFFANVLMIKRDRGTPPPVLMENESTGEKFYVNHQGKPRAAKPIVEQNKVEEGIQLNIHARDMQEARQILTGLKRKYQNIDTEEVLGSAKVIQKPIDEYLTIKLVIGGNESLPALLKMAINYYVEQTGDIKSVEDAIEDLKNNDPARVDSIILEERLFALESKEVTHSIFINGDKESGRLYAIIELYNVVQFIVRLSSKYNGEDFEDLYVYDLLDGTEKSKIPINIPDFDYIFGFSFPSSTPDFAIMQKAIERCLGIATQRQRSYFQNKIIKDSWTATIDKMIPKGSIITEEATEAFTNELMSKLQPYIMRIME